MDVGSRKRGLKAAFTRICLCILNNWLLNRKQQNRTEKQFVVARDLRGKKVSFFLFDETNEGLISLETVVFRCWGR